MKLRDPEPEYEDEMEYEWEQLNKQSPIPEEEE